MKEIKLSKVRNRTVGRRMRMDLGTEKARLKHGTMRVATYPAARSFLVDENLLSMDIRWFATLQTALALSFKASANCPRN